jgi:hypothetical protein
MKVFRNFSFLSPYQLSFFKENGFLSLPGLIPSTEIATIQQRAADHINL